MLKTYPLLRGVELSVRVLNLEGARLLLLLLLTWASWEASRV
jgi:hypothetical protein